MTQTISLELPGDLAQFKLPAAVDHRLTELLDRQDVGQTLTQQEQAEAEGIIDLAEMLTLLSLKAQKA
jgi:hypothetical protein